MNPQQSLRVVLATVGSRGDVQPMLAIAQALAERGHVPVIAAPANFADWVSGLGFEFYPVGIDMQAFLSQNRHLMTGNPVTLVRDTVAFFREQIPLQAEHLLAICEGADAMLFGGLAIAAPSVAQHLQIPLMGVLFTTCVLPSSQHPPPNIPWHGLWPWLNQMAWGVNRVMAGMVLRTPFNALRARLRLPRIDEVHRHLTDAAPLVIAADEVLFPADPAWQGRYRYANFLFMDDPQPLDPGLDAWLRDGLPPVYVGFGSMSGKGTERIGRMLVDALGATGRRCLIGAGWAGLGSGAVPSDWRVVHDVPHAQLFPRVALVVHHGGSGTTAQALRAGAPQVLLPLILDQFHHAHRLYCAGLAPRPVPMERITAPALAQAMQSAMRLPAGPREAAAARLRTSDARAQFVRLLEALVPA